MARFEEITKEDWKKIFTYAGILIGLITIGAFLLVFSNVQGWIFLFWIFLGCSVGTFLLTMWLARTYGRSYRCPECGHIFEVSNFTFFLGYGRGSKLRIGRKYIKCPKCGKKSWKSWMKKIGEK